MYPRKSTALIPVASAFGGIGIYKKELFGNNDYGCYMTNDIREYYLSHISIWNEISLYARKRPFLSRNVASLRTPRSDGAEWRHPVWNRALWSYITISWKLITFTEIVALITEIVKYVVMVLLLSFICVCCVWPVFWNECDQTHYFHFWDNMGLLNLPVHPLHGSDSGGWGCVWVGYLASGKWDPMKPRPESSREGGGNSAPRASLVDCLACTPESSTSRRNACPGRLVLDVISSTSKM